MQGAIAWSYHLLSDDEARLFRILSIFAGGCTLEAVEAVSETVGHPCRTPTLDLLASVIDKNLLRMQSNGRLSRFVMLETVREFAQAQLAATGEAAEVAAAHASWFAAFAEFAEPHLLGPDEREWKLRCDDELANLRAALTWSLDHDVESALRIGAASGSTGTG
jgi:predicted ATPase